MAKRVYLPPAALISHTRASSGLNCSSCNAAPPNVPEGWDSCPSTLGRQGGSSCSRRTSPSLAGAGGSNSAFPTDPGFNQHRAHTHQCLQWTVHSQGAGLWGGEGNRRHPKPGPYHKHAPHHQGLLWTPDINGRATISFPSALLGSSPRTRPERRELPSAFPAHSRSRAPSCSPARLPPHTPAAHLGLALRPPAQPPSGRSPSSSSARLPSWTAAAPQAPPGLPELQTRPRGRPGVPSLASFSDQNLEGPRGSPASHRPLPPAQPRWAVPRGCTSPPRSQTQGRASVRQSRLLGDGGPPCRAGQGSPPAAATQPARAPTSA